MTLWLLSPSWWLLSPLWWLALSEAPTPEPWYQPLLNFSSLRPSLSLLALGTLSESRDASSPSESTGKVAPFQGPLPLAAFCDCSKALELQCEHLGLCVLAVSLGKASSPCQL